MITVRGLVALVSQIEAYIGRLENLSSANEKNKEIKEGLDYAITSFRKGAQAIANTIPLLSK